LFLPAGIPAEAAHGGSNPLEKESSSMGLTTEAATLDYLADLEICFNQHGLQPFEPDMLNFFSNGTARCVAEADLGCPS
jgi:hypothetical protein